MVVSGWNKNKTCAGRNPKLFGNKLNEKYMQHGCPRCYTMRCAKIPSTARKLPQKHRRLKYSMLPIPNSPGSIFFLNGSGSDIPIIIRPTIFIRVHSVHAVGRIRLGARKLPPPYLWRSSITCIRPLRSELRIPLHVKWYNFWNTKWNFAKFSGLLPNY